MIAVGLTFNVFSYYAVWADNFITVAGSNQILIEDNEAARLYNCKLI